MKRKKGWIAKIVVIAVIVLLFVGYNLYRYPTMLRSLSDNTLNDAQVEELREEILSQSDVNVLVAYFSYSGTTRNVATALSEKTGDGLAVYGERRISGTSQIDGWLSELGLTGQERQDQPKQEKTGVQETMPEAIQGEGTEILDLENLPTYTYRQQEIELDNQGQRIYGIAYIPDTENERVSLVICAHGLGGSYHTNMAYAEQLASHGIAAYCFDFRGGGGTMSDGDTTEMSVMTEVADLEIILGAAAGWDFVDTDKMVLLGTSQGGITSAIAAARHTDEVSGLVLMYPAFLVSDAIHEQFNSLEEVPDTFRFNWITAGWSYAEDMWDYDVYAEIGNYTEKVLLMHGNMDGIVPISYSERAAEVYENADYFVIDGAGHGFSGSAFEEAVRYIFDYLQEIGLI